MTSDSEPEVDDDSDSRSECVYSDDEQEGERDYSEEEALEEDDDIVDEVVLGRAKQEAADADRRRIKLPPRVFHDILCALREERDGQALFDLSVNVRRAVDRALYKACRQATKGIPNLVELVRYAVAPGIHGSNGGSGPHHQWVWHILPVIKINYTEPLVQRDMVCLKHRVTHYTQFLDAIIRVTRFVDVWGSGGRDDWPTSVYEEGLTADQLADEFCAATEALGHALNMVT